MWVLIAATALRGAGRALIAAPVLRGAGRIWIAAPASRDRGAVRGCRRWVHPCTAPTDMSGIAPGDPGHIGAPQTAPRSRLARTHFPRGSCLGFGTLRGLGIAQSRTKIAGTARSYAGIVFSRSRTAGDRAIRDVGCPRERAFIREIAGSDFMNAGSRCTGMCSGVSERGWPAARSAGAAIKRQKPQRRRRNAGIGDSTGLSLGICRQPGVGPVAVASASCSALQPSQPSE